MRKGCRSKFQAREVFFANDIPHAKGTTFFGSLKALKFAIVHGFPLVVKTNVSGFSRGSHFPLNNYKELFLGIDAIFAKGIEQSYRRQKTILLEVNSRPYLKMHDVPRYGRKEDLSPYYARLDRLVVEQQDIF